jgi:hypothetical protein
VPPGIPEFWLNVLRNYEEIGEKVQLKLPWHPQSAGRADSDYCGGVRRRKRRQIMQNHV